LENELANSRATVFELTSEKVFKKLINLLDAARVSDSVSFETSHGAYEIDRMA
jgi:hypothetical protein